MIAGKSDLLYVSQRAVAYIGIDGGSYPARRQKRILRGEDVALLEEAIRERWLFATQLGRSYAHEAAGKLTFDAETWRARRFEQLHYEDVIRQVVEPPEERLLTGGGYSTIEQLPTLKGLYNKFEACNPDSETATDVLTQRWKPGLGGEFWLDRAKLAFSSAVTILADTGVVENAQYTGQGQLNPVYVQQYAAGQVWYGLPLFSTWSFGDDAVLHDNPQFETDGTDEARADAGRDFADAMRRLGVAIYGGYGESGEAVDGEAKRFGTARRAAWRRFNDYTEQLDGGGTEARTGENKQDFDDAVDGAVEDEGEARETMDDNKAALLEEFDETVEDLKKELQDRLKEIEAERDRAVEQAKADGTYGEKAREIERKAKVDAAKANDTYRFDVTAARNKLILDLRREDEGFGEARGTADKVIRLAGIEFDNAYAAAMKAERVTHRERLEGIFDAHVGAMRTMVSRDNGALFRYLPGQENGWPIEGVCVFDAWAARMVMLEAAIVDVPCLRLWFKAATRWINKVSVDAEMENLAASMERGPLFPPWTPTPLNHACADLERMDCRLLNPSRLIVVRDPGTDSGCQYGAAPIALEEWYTGSLDPSHISPSFDNSYTFHLRYGTRDELRQIESIEADLVFLRTESAPEGGDGTAFGLLAENISAEMKDWIDNGSIIEVDGHEERVPFGYDEFFTRGNDLYGKFNKATAPRRTALSVQHAVFTLASEPAKAFTDRLDAAEDAEAEAIAELKENLRNGDKEVRDAFALAKARAEKRYRERLVEVKKEADAERAAQIEATAKDELDAAVDAAEAAMQRDLTANREAFEADVDVARETCDTAALEVYTDYNKQFDDVDMAYESLFSAKDAEIAAKEAEISTKAARIAEIENDETIEKDGRGEPIDSDILEEWEALWAAKTRLEDEMDALRIERAQLAEQCQIEKDNIPRLLIGARGKFVATIDPGTYRDSGIAAKDRAGGTLELAAIKNVIVKYAPRTALGRRQAFQPLYDKADESAEAGL